jgi:hypothetical protein
MRREVWDVGIFVEHMRAFGSWICPTGAGVTFNVDDIELAMPWLPLRSMSPTSQALILPTLKSLLNGVRAGVKTVPEF